MLAGKLDGINTVYLSFCLKRLSRLNKTSMPVFHKHRVLYVHVPKTGGTSVMNFFGKTTSAYDKDSMISMENRAKKDFGFAHSLQHTTMGEIEDMGLVQDLVVEKGYRFIATVRDPFDRAMSEIMSRKMVPKNVMESGDTKKMYDTILGAFGRLSDLVKKNPNANDNHLVSQWDFLKSNKTGKIPENLEIIRTETLTEDMRKLGYPRFNLHRNASGPSSSTKYDNLRHGKLLEMVEEMYPEDFRLFGKISVDTK